MKNKFYYAIITGKAFPKIINPQTSVEKWIYKAMVKIRIVFIALAYAISSDQTCSKIDQNCPAIDARDGLWIWETPHPYSHLSCCQG